MKDLAGQVAVVTGSDRGIGRAIAAELAAHGCRVVGLDRDPGSAPPDGVTALQGDLARDDAQSLAERVCAVHGQPTLVVNNVGVDLAGTFLGADPATVDLTFATNLVGPWRFTRALLEPLVAGGQAASVVFVSSLHSHRPRTHPHYSASKAAVAMLVRELAHELGPHGIRVNAVSPGVIATGSVPDPVTEEELARTRRLVPLGRIGRPEDVAHIVAVLLSDDLSAYVTGSDVAVDGGLGTFTWSDQP